MDKFVNESLDDFLSERSWGDADNPGGPIRNAVKAAKSAPARGLRRMRARKIMQKYKKKIEDKITDILHRYMTNVSTLETKIKDRVNRVNAAAADDDSKSNQYEDIMDDLRSTMEGILRSARESVNEYMKTYEESFQARLDRPGTLTGAEFMPEDKTNLMIEWKAVLEEINYLIETQLMDFIDLASIQELSAVKGDLKKFIQDQRGYESNLRHPSEPSSIIDADEKEIYKFFVNLSGATLDNDFRVTDKTIAGSGLNTLGADWVKFIIEGGKLGYVWQKQRTRGKKTVMEELPTKSGGKTFNPMSSDSAGKPIAVSPAKSKVDHLIRSI